MKTHGTSLFGSLLAMQVALWAQPTRAQEALADAAPADAAPAPLGSVAELLDEGAGYKILRVKDRQLQQMLAPQAAAPRARSLALPAPTGEVAQLTSLRGVRDAGLPAWLQRELLEQAGFASWEQVPVERLDTALPAVIVDLDALSLVEVASRLQGGRVQARGLLDEFEDLVDEVGDAVQGVRDALCPKDEENKAERFSKAFSADELKKLTNPIAGGEARLEARFGGQGSIGADVRYRVAKRCGVPYRAELDYVDFLVDGTLNGSTALSGSISTRYQGDVVEPITIPLWAGYYSWLIYIFEINAQMALAVDVGVELEAQANARFDVIFEAEGTLGLTWRCSTSDCTKIRGINTLKYDLGQDPTYEVAGSARLIPYADTSFTVKVGAYGDVLHLGSVRAGLVSALPISLYGYRGNQCGDADGDGSTETVSGLLLDANAELYAYLQASWDGKQRFKDLELSFLGSSRTTQAPLLLHPGRTGSVYRRNLAFQDLLSDGSNLLEPVIKVSASGTADVQLQLQTRSCYPLPDAPTFEVDFGDGSAHYVGKGGAVSHAWASAGKHVIQARLKTDAAGRDLDGPWTSVSLDGDEPILVRPPFERPTPSGRVSADLSGDGCVDERDYDLLVASYGTAARGADLDGDGTVNDRDYLLLMQAWGTGCAGN